MNRYNLTSHGGRGFGWQQMDEHVEGAWVPFEDVNKLQEERDEARALLKRVFGKQCSFTRSNEEACLCRDVERDECMFRWEDGCMEDAKIPEMGRRLDCPYRNIEKEG
jgi:hypothetical protein